MLCVEVIDMVRFLFKVCCVAIGFDIDLGFVIKIIALLLNFSGYCRVKINLHGNYQKRKYYIIENIIFDKFFTLLDLLITFGCLNIKKKYCLFNCLYKPLY